MHAVGNHCSRTSYDARDYLCHRQHHIYPKSYPCNLFGTRGARHGIRLVHNLFFDIYLNRKFTAFPLMAVYFSIKKPHTRHRVCGSNVFYEKIQTVMPFYYSAVG